VRSSRRRKQATRSRSARSSSVTSAAHSRSRSRSSATRTTRASSCKTPSCACSRVSEPSKGGRASSPGSTASSRTSASISFASRDEATASSTSRASSNQTRSSTFLSCRLDGSDPVDVVRRHEIAARLQSAFEQLPPYHRGVIVMREVEGLSYEEMAQVMGVSKGTIMSRLFHARQKLQRALADCYAEQVGDSPRAHAHGSEGAQGSLAAEVRASPVSGVGPSSNGGEP